MILYVEDSKDFTKKLLELIEFNKTAGYKINIQISHFKQQKCEIQKKFRKQFHL